MIESQELKPEIISNDPLIGELGKTIDRTPARLITKGITQNGIYNASDDNADGYSRVNVNIPLGLEYEEGTYAPTEDEIRPTITFSKTHTDTPIYVMIMDATTTKPPTNGLGYWFYIDYDKMLNATIPYSDSINYYELIYLYYIRTGSSYTGTNAQLRYPSSETTDISTSYPRYYVTPTNFKPGVSGTSQAVLVGNRVYKWIAIWK